MKLFKIAHRNLWRNKRRSIITLSAISIGLAALVFVWGFVDGMNEQTIENSTTYLTGHIKIHKKGFHDDKALHLATKHDASLQNKIANTEHVTAVTPRIEDKAMIIGNDEARGTKVIGIDPELEPKVTTIFKSVTQGRYLQADDENTLLIGDKLAERTGLNVGDEAVLISQARDGSMAADRFEVVGIYDSGIDMIDGSNVFIPIRSAQEFYSLWGQVTAWVLRIDERYQASVVKINIENMLGEGYEVLDWKQLMPEMVEMIRFHEIISYVVLFIVAVVVTVGVANTILMAVMERTREFGIMLALGTSQLQVIQIVLMETVVLGVIGLVIGNLIGILITLYFTTVGIDLTQFTLAMETMPGLSGSIFPLLRLDHLMIVSVVVFVISVLPAFYPAWRVSRMQPVEAMRGNIRSRHSKGTMSIPTSSYSRAIFWRITFRSIRRNLRRSVLTAGATAFGLAAFLFLYAFTDGFFEQMIDNSIDFSVAHAQVEPKGYDDELSPKLFITNSTSVIQDLKQSPSVVGVSPRIQVEAMVSSPRQTEPMVLSGVDTMLEQDVSRLHTVIIDGRYLEQNKGPEILLGRKLVEELDIRLGEKVVVTTQLADGSLGSGAYRLIGIYQTDNEIFDRMFGYVGLQQAQSLLAMGDRVSSIAIRLKDRESASLVASELNDHYKDMQLQVRSWDTIMPVLIQMVDVTRLMFFIVLIIVFFVVAMGITNTLFMSVLERTREFGVMLAVGTEPRLIIRMVLYESIILGFSGIIVGIVIGATSVWYFKDSGVDLSGFTGVMGSMPGLTDVIFPVLIIENLWLPTLILFITSIVAGLFPARRAAIMEPVKALRHV